MRIKGGVLLVLVGQEKTTFTTVYVLSVGDARVHLPGMRLVKSYLDPGKSILQVQIRPGY